MKKCLYCSEEIQDEAIKCRFCGEFLNKENPLPAKTMEQSFQEIDPEVLAILKENPDAKRICPQCQSPYTEKVETCVDCKIDLISISSFKKHGGKGDNIQKVPQKMTERSIKCPQCGSQQEVDSTYCDQCGESLVIHSQAFGKLGEPQFAKNMRQFEVSIKCRDCHKSISNDALICPSCGAPKPSLSKAEFKALVEWKDQTARRLFSGGMLGVVISSIILFCCFTVTPKDSQGWIVYDESGNMPLPLNAIVLGVIGLVISIGITNYARSREKMARKAEGEPFHVG